MKKFLLIALSMLLASGAYAADRPTDRMEGATNVFASSTLKKAPLKVSQNEDDYPLVREAPAGTTNTYLQDADVYFQIFGEVATASDVGLTREVVFCDDGTVWFKNFLSGVTTDTYIKGTKNGNKIRIEFPQAIREITDNTTGQTSKAYVYRIKHGVDGPLDFSVYPIAEQHVEFDVNDDNSLITWDDPDDFVGMCTFNGGWYGIGAWNYAFRQIDATLVDFPPSGVAREDWTLIWEGFPEIFLFAGTKDVKVAVDEANSEVYIGGLLTTTNDMVTWIKGTLANGKATFPSGQYLGRNEYDEYVYFMGATVGVGIDPTWNVPTIVTSPLPELVFDYNGDTKTLMIAQEGQMISLNRGKGEIYGDYMPNPIVQMQIADKIAAAPKNPRITDFVNWEGGNGMFSFSLSTLNVNNMILDTDDIFYNIYVNGEIYTLTKEVYSQLDYNTLTDIPFAYGFWDLYNNYGAVTFYWIIPEEITSMGVRSFYEDPATGERYYSDIVTYKIGTDATAEAITESEVIATEWLDLTGTKVSDPQSGLYIKVDTYADGSRRVAKTLMR